MVDRITPATTDDDRAEVARRFGVDDAWPVVCEHFTQWVLEDRFGLGRPPLEDAGVQIVDDVDPYERMKLRLLNASHQALAYLGDLEDYRRTLIARFSNPHIRDTLARLAFDGSERLPKWLLPVVRDQLARGGEVRRSAAVVAGWARYSEGVDEQGRPIEIADVRRDPLMAAARREREEPLAFLADRALFGDLVDDERFTGPYLAALASLHERGARATLEALVEDALPAPSTSLGGTGR
jgi:mannitol 2-dehydrogenase